MYGCTEKHLSVLFTIVTLQNFTVTNDIRSTNNTGCVTTSILGQCSNSLPSKVHGIEAYNQIGCVVDQIRFKSEAGHSIFVCNYVIYEHPQLYFKLNMSFRSVVFGFMNQL